MNSKALKEHLDALQEKLKGLNVEILKTKRRLEIQEEKEWVESLETLPPKKDVKEMRKVLLKWNVLDSPPHPPSTEDWI